MRPWPAATAASQNARLETLTDRWLELLGASLPNENSAGSDFHGDHAASRTFVAGAGFDKRAE